MRGHIGVERTSMTLETVPIAIQPGIERPCPFDSAAKFALCIPVLKDSMHHAQNVAPSSWRRYLRNVVIKPKRDPHGHKCHEHTH
jgi:hypothetical protein